MQTQSYNGWKNYETWNVALWIMNDEDIYNLARSCDSYNEFVNIFAGETLGGGTKDGISWYNTRLDKDALDELINDL